MTIEKVRCAIIFLWHQGDITIRVRDKLLGILPKQTERNK
jgi:hypothetical protein